MSYLPGVAKECWFHIASYLAYSDVLQVSCTCLTLSNYGSDSRFWEDFLHENFIPVELRRTIRSVEHAKVLVAKIMYHLFYDNVQNVTFKTISTSSVDQQAEGPKNTLTKSPCLQRVLNVLHANTRLNVNERIQYGEHFQALCGCMGTGSPCYYSSAPSPNPNKTEYITYLLHKRPVFVFAFTITPFQAYFHPRAPVYAPLEVCVQFLRGDRTVTPKLNQITPLSDEQLEQDVYYQSPYYTVQQASLEQVFSLPSPTLCSDARVRVVFRGMRQRQTLGPAFGEDYYMCISHFALLAAPIELELERVLAGEGSESSVVYDLHKKNTASVDASNALERVPYDLSELLGADEVLCPSFFDKHCEGLSLAAQTPSLQYELFDNGEW